MNNLKVFKEITLDFFNRKMVTVEAKQLDKKTRRIVINCTSNGEPYALDSTKHYAYIRMRKPDGKNVFNACTIEQGKVVIDLTEQMLNVAGLCVADIMITDNVVTIDSTNTITPPTVGIVSTMRFQLSIEDLLIDYAQIESTNEFNALNQLFDQASAMQTNINKIKNEKLDKQQGTDNSGKVLAVGTDGIAVPTIPKNLSYNKSNRTLVYGDNNNMPLATGVLLDNTVSKVGYAAEASATKKMIDNTKSYSAKILTLWSGQLLTSNSENILFRLDHDDTYDPEYNLDGLKKVQLMIETIEGLPGYGNWQVENQTYFTTIYFEDRDHKVGSTVLPYQKYYQGIMVALGNARVFMDINTTSWATSQAMHYNSNFGLQYDGTGKSAVRSGYNKYITKISAIIPSKQEVY